MRIEGRVWKFGDDVDTDLIIPARYINVSDPDVLAKTCFIDIAPEFASAVAPGDVIVAGKNFGCGSSREHAPWALLDFGIRSIIAPSYADIFYNNCFKNGILPIVLPKETVEELLAQATDAQVPMTIDLPEQQIKAGNTIIAFDIDPFRKKCLLEGLDDIGLTLAKKDSIARFEERNRQAQPWLYSEDAHV